jgi:hypothetical protein
MNTREAILRSADHIERRPGEFDFDSVDIPDRPGCGTPGCAIGWIAHFTGYDEINSRGFDRVLPVTATEFYIRMDEMSGGARPVPGSFSYVEGEWRTSAAVCAATLRRYADTYHPAESRDPIPASVRAIFAMTPEQIRAEFQRDAA